MCILRYIFAFKALFPLVNLLCRTDYGQTYDNIQMGPDGFYENWGVIKAGPMPSTKMYWHQNVI